MTVINRLGSVATVSSSAGTSAVVNLPANRPAGSACVIFIATNATSTVSTPTGWGGYDPLTDGGLVYRQFTKTLDGSESTASITLGSSVDWAAVAVTYSGVAQPTQGGSGYHGVWTTGVQDYTVPSPETSTDTTHTISTRTSQYDEGWGVCGPAQLSTTGSGWTSVTSTGTPTPWTKVVEGISSGTSKVQIAAFDTNGVIEKSLTSRTLTATSPDSASDRGFGAIYWRPDIVGINRAKTGVSNSSGAGSGTSATATSGSTLTTLGMNVNGLLLWAYVVNNAGTTASTPAGWTRLGGAIDGNCATDMFYKISTTSDTAAVTSTLGATCRWQMTVGAFSGVDTANPWQNYAFTTEAGSNATLTTPSYSNGVAGGWRLQLQAHVNDTSSGFASTSTTPDSKNLSRSNITMSGTGNITQSCFDSNGPMATGSYTSTVTSGIAVTDKVIFVGMVAPAAATSPDAGTVAGTAAAYAPQAAPSAAGGTGTAAAAAYAPQATPKANGGTAASVAAVNAPQAILTATAGSLSGGAAAYGASVLIGGTGQAGCASVAVATISPTGLPYRTGGLRWPPPARRRPFGGRR